MFKLHKNRKQSKPAKTTKIIDSRIITYKADKITARVADFESIFEKDITSLLSAYLPASLLPDEKFRLKATININFANSMYEHYSQYSFSDIVGFTKDFFDIDDNNLDIRFKQVFTEYLKSLGWEAKIVTETDADDYKDSHTLFLTGSLNSRLTTQADTTVKDIFNWRNVFIRFFNEQLKSNVTAKTRDTRRIDFDTISFKFTSQETDYTESDSRLGETDYIAFRYRQKLIQGFCEYISDNSAFWVSYNRWETISVGGLGRKNVLD